jgi:hypothetical protein
MKLWLAAFNSSGEHQPTGETWLAIILDKGADNVGWE